MSLSRPRVQAHWDVANSSFKAWDVAVALVRAASQDDVQVQAILAMEGLGAGMHGLVSQEMIAHGAEALNNGHTQVFKWLNLLIGFNRGGIAKTMSESTPLVASFLLATACRTSFTNEEASHFLFKMMESQNILRTVPIYPRQIEQLVNLVSAYGDKLLPTRNFNDVKSKIEDRLPFSRQMPRLLAKGDIEVLAKTASHVFEALIDADVDQVTIEGADSGVWLVSVFRWLLPEETACLLRGNYVFGKVGARLHIDLKDEEGWQIHEWRNNSRLDTLIKEEDKAPRLIFEPMSHYPLESAKSVIANVYGFEQNPTALEAIGQLAAALVDVAYDQGYVCSGDDSLSMPLKEICQEHFISNHPTIMNLFGWSTNTGLLDDVAWTISHQIGKPTKAQQDPSTEALKVIQESLYNCMRDNIKGCMLFRMKEDVFIEIIEPAVFLATEALLTCFCDKLSPKRLFRPCTKAQVKKNAEIFRHLLYARSIQSTDKLAHSVSKGCPFWLFRVEALKAALPGAPEVSASDLAVFSNGYVAYSAAIAGPTLDRYANIAISILPGSIRRDNQKDRFDRLEEKGPNIALYGRSFIPTPRPVELFNGGEYISLTEKSDPERAAVKYLINPFKNALHLTTYLNVPEDGPPSSASWKSSIEALAFAQYVDDHTLRPSAEESLARRWQQRGILSALHWCKAGEKLVSPKRHIMMAYPDQSIRFFEAGYWHGEERRKVFIKRRAPLFECVMRAMELGDDASWIVLS
jgi:hypothetical protein